MTSHSQDGHAKGSVPSTGYSTTNDITTTAILSNGGRGQQQTGDRLAALPDHLLIRIFEILGTISETKTNLFNVALLSKRYSSLVDSVLYKEVSFGAPKLHGLFNTSLNRRPRRGSAILDLTLSYPPPELEQLLSPQDESFSSKNSYHHTDGSGVSRELSRALSTMSNLRNLTLSVPDALAPGIGTLFNGPFDLACLKTCTLFYQSKDEQYWDLQDNIHIFAHPTLESLTIRRAKLDYRGFDSIERPHETALHTLHLIECDINDDALSDVLEFPQALREFVMTQSPEPNPELEESSDDVGDYIAALKAHVASLETITIDSSTLKGYKPLRMRDFEALKTLRLNWDHQLFGATSKKPRLHSVGLPPSLRTLEFFNELGTDEAVTDLLVATIQARDILARDWKELIVVADDEGEIPRDVKEAAKEHALKLNVIGGVEDLESEPQPELQPEPEPDMELGMQAALESDTRGTESVVQDMDRRAPLVTV